MIPKKLVRLAFVVAAVAGAGGALPAFAGNRPLAAPGDAAPDTLTTFNTFAVPVINDLGEVAFHSTLGSGSGGVFLGGSTNPITKVVAHGDSVLALPDGFRALIAPDDTVLPGGFDFASTFSQPDRDIALSTLGLAIAGRNGSEDVLVTAYRSTNHPPFWEVETIVAEFGGGFGSSGSPLKGQPQEWTLSQNRLTPAGVASGSPIADEVVFWSTEVGAYVDGDSGEPFDDQFGNTPVFVGFNGDTLLRDDESNRLFFTGFTTAARGTSIFSTTGSSPDFIVNVDFDTDLSVSTSGVAILTGSSDRRIETVTGASPGLIIRVGDPVNSLGAIDDIGNWLRIDNAGRILFPAFVGGAFQGSILRADAGNPRVAEELVRSGDPTPDGDGVFAIDALAFNDGPGFHQNNTGQVLFDVPVSGSSRDRGLFLTDGIETRQVLRRGDLLGGKVVDQIALKSGNDPGGKQAFNDFGQIAYRVRFTDGTEAVYLYTPDLTFRGTAGDGQWGTASNWTLSIQPDVVHAVSIEGDVQVTGPTEARSIASLALGKSGAASSGPTLTLTGDAGLTITDDLEIDPSATLGFDLPTLASTAAIRVHGNATLAGTLDLTALGFVPAPGDALDLVVVDGVLAGSFETVLGAGWAVAVNGGVLTATFVGGSGLVGDLNGDGFVGAGDLDILLGAWNQSVGDSPADLNGDGFIGAGDLDLLLGNWNAGNPTTATAVPEPAAWAIGGLGLGGYGSRRRRPYRRAGGVN